MRHIIKLHRILIYLLLVVYIISCNIHAYDSVKPPELQINLVSSKDTYYRDEMITLNYTINNRYGTAQDFVDNGRNVFIKILDNFTFKSISILDHDYNKIHANNDSNIVRIRLPYSPDNWTATYANLCLRYNTKSPPSITNFFENGKHIALDFNPYIYTKNKYHNITLLNRLPILNNCIKRIIDGRNVTIVCEGLDRDSEMLIWHIYGKKGNELTNNSSINKYPGEIIKHEVDYTETGDEDAAHYMILSDGYNSSEKVIISSENDMWHSSKLIVIFILIYIFVSYFFTPNISVIYLIVNRNRSNIHAPSNNWFLASDLWMVTFAIVFGLGSVDINFVVDSATAINILMIILTILGYYKEKIAGILHTCILLCILFFIMLIAAQFYPKFSMFIIFLSLPSILYMYYKYSNTYQTHPNE